MGTMDLNHLSVFAAVAETASFTEAARRLGVPKSTVSRGVASLEASLGVRLLQRTTRSVALTTAGQALVDRLGSRLKALTEAIEGLPELEDEPSGTLRLTATADFATEVLAEILAAFCRRYPRITVEMHLSTQPVDLVKEGYDVAFRFFAKKPRDSTLVACKVGELHLQFYASPAYLAARGTPRTLDDLAAHDCVALIKTSPFGRDEVSRARARLRVRWLANDGFFAREVVRNGGGIGLLPTFLVQQDVLAGALVRVLPRWTAPTGGVFLVFPSGQHLPRKTVALRDHVVEALRMQLKVRAGRVGEG
ncbi:LysR substrate-binding domain-containing protein [Sorangium sp. So ce124]|uniref:LysR family transcriptional regulator n=1 Tax=Sorangium sp. So ce124 TaxID=3133280 RepID=UPI003F601E65